MEDFIRMAVRQLGVAESDSRAATGGVLKLIKEQLSDGDFSELTSKLPGVKDLLKSAPQEGQAQGQRKGGGGGLLGAAASMLGGQAGAAFDLTSVLKNSGLGLDKAGPFLSMLVGFLQENLGDSLVSKILASVPGLNSTDSTR